LEFKFTNPKINNVIAINRKIKLNNALIPDPIIKGKNKINSNSTCLLMKAIMKKNKLMEKNMIDNI
jgi:hypothetical protein